MFTRTEENHGLGVGEREEKCSREQRRTRVRGWRKRREMFTRTEENHGLGVGEREEKCSRE